jgi:F0F1-type ATP synthase assembly protein I
MNQGVNLRLLGLVGQVGVVMVVFILIGLVVGQWIDARLGTSPSFTFVFIFLGIGAAGWSIARMVMWALEGTSGKSVDGKDSGG